MTAIYANGRCKLHGGMSTGAKTPEGIERIREAQRRRRAREKSVDWSSGYNTFAQDIEAAMVSRR